MTIDLKDKLYTSTQVADILGVSLRTLYRYMEDGKIDSMRTASGRHRFTRENILNFLNGDKQVNMSDIINPGQPQSSFTDSLRYREEVRDSRDQFYVGYDRNARQNNSAYPYSDDSKREMPIKSNINDHNYKQTNYTDYPEHKDNFGARDYGRTEDARRDMPRDDLPSSKIDPYTERQQKPIDKPYLNKSNFDFLDDDFLTPSVPNNARDEIRYNQYAPKKVADPVISSNRYDSDHIKQTIADDDSIKEKPVLYDSGIRTNKSPQVTESQPERRAIEEDRPVKISDNLNIEYFSSSIQDLVELAKLIKQNATEFNLRYAFTGYAGASLHFLIKPFTVLHFYIDSYDYNFWVKTLGLKRSNQADANIGIVQSRNFRVQELKNIGGFYVVDDLQLKSDLEELNESEIAERLE